MYIRNINFVYYVHFVPFVYKEKSAIFVIY